MFFLPYPLMNKFAVLVKMKGIIVFGAMALQTEVGIRIFIHPHLFGIYRMGHSRAMAGLTTDVMQSVYQRQGEGGLFVEN